MKLKKYTLTKAFYNERKDVDFYLPEGLVFVRVYPSRLHYDNQVDMLSIIECSKEDENLIYKKNHWISTYRLGKYLIIILNSVNDSEEIPQCTLEELNNKYDLTEYFIIEFDSEYNLLYIAKIKGLSDSENLLVDCVDIGLMFSNKKLQSINVNTDLPIDRLYTNCFSDHQNIKILNNDKAKTIFYTLISRYLKETGIEWRNEFVDDTLDINYIKNLYDNVEKIKIGEITDDNFSSVIDVLQKDIKIFEKINKWLDEKESI